METSKKFINSKKFVEQCPKCKSKKGLCNMWKPEIIEPQQISIAGHCQDCGYSFTMIFSLSLFEILDRK